MLSFKQTTLGRFSLTHIHLLVADTILSLQIICTIGYGVSLVLLIYLIAFKFRTGRSNRYIWSFIFILVSEVNLKRLIYTSRHWRFHFKYTDIQQNNPNPIDFQWQPIFSKDTLILEILFLLYFRWIPLFIWSVTYTKHFTSPSLLWFLCFHLWAGWSSVHQWVNVSCSIQ